MATPKKDPKRVAAGKKGARARKRGSSTPAKRRKRGMSARRKKGFLSELFSPAASRGAADAVVSGAVGGGIAGITMNVLGAGRPLMDQVMILGAESFIFGAMLNMPNVGAGIAGVAGFKLFDDMVGLTEDYEGNMEYTEWIEDGALSQPIDYALAQEPDYSLAQNQGGYGYAPFV